MNMRTPRRPSARRRSEPLRRIAVALILAVTPTVCQAGPIRVYLLAGQSNMVGGASAAPNLTPQPNVLFQYRLITSVERESTTWGPLRSLAGEMPGASYGIELTFAKAMA